MTASSDSSTAAALRPAGRRRPGRELLFLLLFLVGAAACVAGLVHLRSQLAVDSFAVRGAALIPVERVRAAGRDSYPVHFLLLHGYHANRRHLLHLAEVLAVAGADVYVLDFPGRGDSTAAASPRPSGPSAAALPTGRETAAALAVVRRLEEAFGLRPERLVVVGHSMGGGVALELGREINPIATISLAGLERPVAPGKPRNLLLLTATLEIPELRRAADRMFARARTGPDGRAARIGRLEFRATHASLPFHSSVQRVIVLWTNRTLPDAHLATPPHFNESLLLLEFGGLFCLGALVAPLAGLAGWALGHEPFSEAVPETRFTLWTSFHLAGYALLAGGASVSLIRLLAWAGWRNPLSFLHLMDGDYLASVLLLSTLWFLPLLRHRAWVRSWRETAASVAVGGGLAAYVILVGGGFVTWQLFDLWPTWGRLARMLGLVVLLFPCALGEELLLRTCSKQERGTTAFGTFLTWRLALLAAILYGALVLGSGEEMLVVVALPLVLLSLVEFFFTAQLYRALRSVWADATLKALLLGWVIAALFPLG